MTRTDFLMKLFDALEGLPSEVRTEIISEYQEYFRSEEETGRTEENIIASLGDPVALAQVIKNRKGFTPQSDPINMRKPRSSRRFVTWVIVAMIMMGVFGGIGSAIKMVVKGGFDKMLFGVGTQYDVNDVKEVNWDNAKTIEIHTTSTDTTLFSAQTEKVKAALTGSVKTTNPDAVPTLEIKQSGDTISIIEKRKVTSIIGFYSSNVKLDISIPESFNGVVAYNGTSGNFTSSNLKLKTLRLDLSSGDVDLENISLEEDFFVSSTSGNTEIHGLQAKAATLKATSGDKEFLDFSVSGDIHILSHSGNTRIENLNCKQIILESTSGDIKAEKSKVDLFSVNSSSGNITLKDLEGAARVKSTSGNIEVLYQLLVGEVNLSATSGNIKLSVPSGSGFDLEARSSSGNIDCAFDLEHETRSKGKLQGVHGSGEVPVTLAVTSGNIKVMKK